MRPPFNYVKWPHRPRVIGPRFIPYLDAAGDPFDASVRVRMGAREVSTFAHVEGFEHVELEDRLMGRFWVEIDGHRWAKTFRGSDDIHLLRICMWFAGDWLIRTAQEEGADLAAGQRDAGDHMAPAVRDAPMTTAVEDLVLGPRVISFCRVPGADAAAANDDEDEEGSLLMTLRSLEADEVMGWADIELDGQTARLETRGVDELQVTYELIQLSGAWLIETAKARGLILFAWGQKPVVAPMDVFVL